MIRKSFVAATILLLAGLALAAREGKEVKLNGYIIDNMCASAHSDTLADTAKGHPTACATMPNCVKSGYSLVSDGKQYKLDEDGNKKVMGLLKSSKSKKGLSVTVEGMLEGDTLKVKKISESES